MFLSESPVSLAGSKSKLDYLDCKNDTLLPVLIGMD